MTGKGIAGLRRLVLGASVAAAVAGCAGPPLDAGEGTVVVMRIERAVWNAPAEPGLFRVVFDARRAQQIRRQAGLVEAPEGLDSYFVEPRVLEAHAERELKARGLCSASVTLVSYLEGVDVPSGIGAIFRCRTPVF